MRIIILTQYFHPEMGAPQNRLLELALGLKKLNWDVEIVTAMPNYPTGRIFDLYKGKFSVKENVMELPTHRYWMYPSNSSRTFPRIVSMLSFSFASMFSFFKLRKFRPDYLLVESPPLTLAFTGWMLSRLVGSRLIMNVSDLWPLSAKELGAIKEGFAYKWLLKLELFLYKKSDVCTGQSQEIVDYISKRKGSNVWLLRNGVDISRFDTIQKVRTNRIVYAGLVGVAQGLDSICKNISFRELGLEFHIYGTGSGVKEIEAIINKSPNNGIKYCGVISRDQVPAILEKYDVMLVSLVKSIYGAVPSKIYEAMAAGLPIIFSGEGEGAKIVKQEAIGWVNKPGNWIQLRENLNIFQGLSAIEFFQLKHKSRSAAEKKYSRKNQISEFNDRLRRHHKIENFK